MQTLKIGFLTAMCLLRCVQTTVSGPPFLTDDPEPVDYRHGEFYVASQHFKTADDWSGTAPHVEVNYGAVSNLQLHLIAPAAYDAPEHGARHYGYGDTELGAKYRFIQETSRMPQVGIFPLLEIPTGDAKNNLGSGHVQAFLPLWLQKSWGPWTTYGGGGVVFNSAPGQRNYPFAGWLVQRDFGPHWTLGGELFAQDRDTDDDRGFATLNFGGSYNFNEHFSLLFSAGHTVAGDTHTFWYFGLYWTWGPKSSKP